MGKNVRACFLLQALKFRRPQDDPPRRVAQTVDRLGRQDEGGGLQIQEVALGLVGERSERHVNGVDLSLRWTHPGADRQAYIGRTSSQVADLALPVPPRGNVFQLLD